MKTPLEALIEARELLGSHGWCQGRSRDGSAFCASAALGQVIYKENYLTLSEPEKVEHNALACATADYLMQAATVPVAIGSVATDIEKAAAGIIKYNDIFLRTANDALAWFDRAIELARISELVPA